MKPLYIRETIYDPSYLPPTIDPSAYDRDDDRDEDEDHDVPIGDHVRDESFGDERAEIDDDDREER
jgi:hypothetical protein